MTQQIINYGAAPNDGTGDPLRTAFIKTDDNFDQIWAAGPVGSNITILNNTVGVTNTNGNLILSPNGIGVVQVNNHMVPRANRVYDLGSSSLQYRAVYANAVNATALSVAGDQTVSGDLTVAGNLIVEGDTIQIGNITTDTKTIQLSNSASNAAAANLSGVTVGANDNIATLLYNSTSNTWTTNIGVTATGNITAPYLFGNAAFVTGLPAPYGNSNVAAFLAAYGSNTLVTTGNITAGNLTVSSAGNTWTISDQYIRGPGGAYWHSHPEQQQSEFVSAPGEFISIRSVDGANVTQAELYLGNTYTEIFVENGVNHRWRFDETGQLEAAGDIIPVTAGSAPANIGTVSNPWTHAQFSGNVTANFFIGNGSQLTGVSNYANANAVSYADSGWSGNIIPAGNAVYSLGNASNQWSNLWVANNTIYIGGVPLGIGTGNVLTVGGEPILSNDSNTSISTTGNITANYFIGDGSLLTGLPASYSDANVATFLAAFGSNTISTTGNITAGNFIGNISLTGNVQGTAANVTLVAGSYSTVFDNTGTATFPGNIVGNTAGFAIGYRDIPQISFTGDATLAATAAGKHYYSTLATANTLTIANNTSVSWSVGTAITVVNRGSGNITIAQGTGVSLYLAGNSTAGNRTVTTYGMATLLNVAANIWMINGTGVV